MYSGMYSSAKSICAFSLLPSVQNLNFSPGIFTTDNNRCYTEPVSKHKFTQVTLIPTGFTNNQLLSVTIGSNSPICAGSYLNLTSIPSGGTAPFTYSWTGPNGFTSTQQNPIIPNATAPNAGTYSLTVTDAAAGVTNASISVTVNAFPSVAAISGNATGCVGSTVALTDATTGGVWSSSNTTVATVGNTGLVNVLSLGSSTISYAVTNVSGCTTTVIINISAASVTLLPDVIECNNGITHFSSSDIYYGVTYSNLGGGNTYLWSVTGGTSSYQGSSSATSQYPNMQLLTGSSFQVIVQFTTNGVTCIDTQMVYKNTIAADTIKGSHDTTVCFNTAPISLTGKVSAVTNAYSWTSSGSGVFSAANSLNTTYKPLVLSVALGV